MKRTDNVLKKNVLFIGKAFDTKWELEDPTGKLDDEFKKAIKMIAESYDLVVKKRKFEFVGGYAYDM